MNPDSPSIAAESPDKSPLDRAPQSSTSTTLERSSLESLPDEVLIDIIRNGEAENTPCVAWSLCLVSKRMEPVARQELYREISILTYRSLRSLCRTLEKKPELGQHMVELNLLVPSDLRGPSNPSYTLIKTFDFERLWYFYSKLLRRSAGLRKLTMMMVGQGQSSRSTMSPYHRFIHGLSGAITRSQHSGSIIAILPRLEQVRLINDAHLQHWWNRAMVYPEVFKPFLHLSPLSSLECIEDSGV
ncbi:hypothetical protein INS49_005009 [Diaporthe citri]|uniref:uncharacterized protein n=1 Tax=Diaporthe citri TaxID=83186 RepID=UPI001C7F6A75|nr:uncharacterized protein INS49_005009 [Diaporthe citri]KAG6354038.1 hypothetical protein INS49_005009 [Diaporthe citri]